MIKDKKPYTILVIEDNPGDFEIVNYFLNEYILDPVIVHVQNFSQAAGVLSAGDMSFDIILLDLSLPDKSGQELISAMLNIASACPIIILTGYTDITFSINSISHGIYDYLLKDDLSAIMLYKSIIYSIERKNSISKLTESEKRYSNLFNLSPQPKWLYDPQTLKFIHVNKAALILYGYTEEEFLNMTMDDIKYEESITGIHKQTLFGGTPSEVSKMTAKHYKKSKEIIEVEIYISPIIINNKDFRSVIVIDVTERNLFETKVTKAIIKTQEDERTEISSELHDNVCQLLAASKLGLGMLKESPSERIGILSQCHDNISTALDEIRNLSHRLAPVLFNESTMEEAFRRLFDTFNIGGEFEIVMQFEDAVKQYPLSFELQLNLYRILQEQLKNILHNAKASVIKVDVFINNSRLKMRISDNGIGFNLNAIKSGIGIANMKRRTELFSGIFEIESSPGNGCTILIDIPLHHEMGLN